MWVQTWVLMGLEWWGSCVEEMRDWKESFSEVEVNLEFECFLEVVGWLESFWMVEELVESSWKEVVQVLELPESFWSEIELVLELLEQSFLEPLVFWGNY